MFTSSFGVGELIKKALDFGAERILVGCGDSGISDGHRDGTSVRHSFFRSNWIGIRRKEGGCCFAIYCCH
ncbi:MULTISPECIES: glycerate kinase [Shouchella]|uniref:glycerate kinase n=1 Tax=Shouchella TaxID=2893057 RepID=UPI00031C6ECC|nr:MULTISPECIES: glycerate kinase [Shouchella]MBU3230198.1 glycerate kinase [Shouchella clausii]MBU3262603.1 glycerate kinase [Shouchella clausii]MBU3507082.1 glycerate kinase [Shouchella clausii]MBU3534606.1 glycerate kinase [Shouchella clausii]MBX0306532.1 glycerate kinase [Shouchella clausii]